MENVDDERRRSEQGRLELLFLRIVGADGGDEGARHDIILLEKRAARGGARHADVTSAKGGLKIFDRLEAHAVFPCGARSQTFSTRMVDIEEHDPL